MMSFAAAAVCKREKKRGGGGGARLDLPSAWVGDLPFWMGRHNDKLAHQPSRPLVRVRIRVRVRGGVRGVGSEFRAGVWWPPLAKEAGEKKPTVVGEK